MTDLATDPNKKQIPPDIDQQDSILQSQTEQARGASNKVEALIKELEETQGKVADLQQQLESAHDKIKTQNAQIEEQNAALAKARESATQQSQQLEKTSQNNDQLIQGIEQLETTKNEVDLTLTETLQQVDALNEQAKKLESRFQTSLQRTTEQEDALLHWQELAETTQTRLKKLAKQKEILQRQLEESSMGTGKLREKNSRLEFEWQRTLMELDDLRDRISEDAVEEMQSTLAKAQQKITLLNNIIADSDEQLLWHKASLKTTQRALEESRRLANYQESLLGQLESESTPSKPSPNDEPPDSDIKILKEALHHKSVQLDAHTSEIEHHLNQMDAQGKRLAEIQATLIERELQLEQTMAKSAKQSEFIKRMKQATAKHIQKLEAQLSQAQQFK